MLTKIAIELELRPFTVPNFVIANDGKTRPRHEGFSEAPKYAIKDLDEKTLSALCDKFRADVFEKAEKDDPRL